jgi:rubredoxin
MVEENMKCLCGYKYERDIGNEHLDKGDNPFIHLGNVTGISEKGSEFYGKYACPKCGTIKISL